MEEVVLWVRWWNLMCYLSAFMILLYKFVLSVTICPKHDFDWIKFVLVFHLLLGFFTIGEVLYTNSDWGWRTFLTALVSGATVVAVIFKVKVQDDCARSE